MSIAVLLFLVCSAPTLSFGESGSFGAYPMHGGNHMKQQIALDSNINKDNVHSLASLCTFSQDGSSGYIGYPVVDDDNNTYFTDNSGYKSINIETCTLNWEVSNAEFEALLGVDEGLSSPSMNTPALIETDGGDRAVLFGYHQLGELLKGNFTLTSGCYIAALRVEDGSLLYSATIVEAGHQDTSYCRIHGVMIEHQYAFGGTSNYGYTTGMEQSSWSDDGPQLWRGKAFKMDINTGQLVAEWYSLPEYDYDTLDTELFYRSSCSVVVVCSDSICICSPQ